jgi:hypothetical protein
MGVNLPAGVSYSGSGSAILTRVKSKAARRAYLTSWIGEQSFEASHEFYRPVAVEY